MLTTLPSDSRLMVVSNRLPIILRRDAQDEVEVEPASGGLVTALTPVIKQHQGMWFGWAGTVAEDGVDLDAVRDHAAEVAGFDAVPVALTAEERDKFYLGFSNEIVWPLFHDLQSRCNFRPDYWTNYQQVNRAFAEVVARHARPDDYIWIHDYHLMTLAQVLRELGVRSPLGFFLHIPFPPLDIFAKLPWRREVLGALLHNELIGFQTERDRRNFVECMRVLRDDVTLEEDQGLTIARSRSHTTRIGVFPISIDARDFAARASSREGIAEAESIRRAMPSQTLILGVDRLDYTKGLPEKLEAYRHALLRYPDLRGKVRLIQIVVPSRGEIASYGDLKAEVERLVGQINGQFTTAGWAPIRYIGARVAFETLLAYYHAADIALVTPLKDGMNLVAKEFAVCSQDDAVLILSEFAGAAAQLGRDALLVNPYDVEGVAGAIYRACGMTPDERRARNARLRERALRQDVFWWVDSFLDAGLMEKTAW